MNSPYSTMSPAFTPAARVAGAAAARLEMRARLNGRMSSVSVRRVCDCFRFTGAQPAVLYVTLFLLGYSNLAFFLCLSLVALRGKKF